MSRNNEPEREPPIFSAVLTPHRSLSPRGFLIVMALLGGISFAAGMVFLMAGAWPVFGFFGLDILLVYFAFKLNYRAARAYEQVTVTPSELTLRKVSHHGRERVWTLNPVWVRLIRDVHEEFGLRQLFLESRGRRLSVGHFLPPEEKESFALALSGALAEARRGPTRTVFE